MEKKNLEKKNSETKITHRQTKRKKKKKKKVVAQKISLCMSSIYCALSNFDVILKMLGDR